MLPYSGAERIRLMLTMPPKIVVIGHLPEDQLASVSLVGEIKVFPATGVVKHGSTRPELGLPDLQVLNPTLRDAKIFVYPLSGELNKDVQDIIHAIYPVAPILILRNSDDEEHFRLVRAGVTDLIPENPSKTLLRARIIALLRLWLWAEDIAVNKAIEKNMNKK